jgi:flagellar basal-body rod modification protein FlgD
MTTVASLEAARPLTDTTAKSKQVLDTDDFMKILLTELTNQDPFEPMKNQELLNQISSIQELQSNQSMADSFTKITDRFDGFMGQLDTFLNREQLSSAGGMIGQMVSGTSTNGQAALGKVVAVTMDQNEILLELDTGDTVRLNDMTRLGGNSTDDIIGSLVISSTAGGENLTVGVIESIEINGSNVTLHLESGEKMSLRDATIITPDTVHYLQGQFVKGPGDKQGYVQSYRVDGPGLEDITLILDTGEQFGVTELNSIRSVNA